MSLECEQVKIRGPIVKLPSKGGRNAIALDPSCTPSPRATKLRIYLDARGHCIINQPYQALTASHTHLSSLSPAKESCHSLKPFNFYIATYTRQSAPRSTPTYSSSTLANFSFIFCINSSYFLVIFSSPSVGTSNFMLRSSFWISEVASRTLLQL